MIKEFKECIKQFWNFGKNNTLFLDVQETRNLVQLLGKIVKTVREDKKERLA